MTREVWKSFEDNLLTHSAAHYLMTIHDLLHSQGYARVTDIAKRLNITRGSCSISLKPLKKRGWVVEDANKFLSLSEDGRQLALVVERNDELLERFFRDVLGVGAEQSEIDACKIEHLLSVETSVKLAAFIDCLSSKTKSVKDFLRILRRHTESCQRKDGVCPTCRTSCFYESAPAVRDARKR